MQKVRRYWSKCLKLDLISTAYRATNSLIKKAFYPSKKNIVSWGTFQFYFYKLY